MFLSLFQIYNVHYNVNLTCQDMCYVSLIISKIKIGIRKAMHGIKNDSELPIV